MCARSVKACQVFFFFFYTCDACKSDGTTNQRILGCDLNKTVMCCFNFYFYFYFYFYFFSFRQNRFDRTVVLKYIILYYLSLFWFGHVYIYIYITFKLYIFCFPVFFLKPYSYILKINSGKQIKHIYIYIYSFFEISVSNCRLQSAGLLYI